MPYIDAPMLLAILEDLASATPFPPDHPVWQFQWVRQRLLEPHNVTGEHGDWAVVRSCVEMCLLEILGPDRNDMADVEAQIAEDFSQEHEKRESYSYLYYRYLRDDLDIPIQAFAKMAHVVERTLRRRRLSGLNHLASDFVLREIASRRAEHRAYLHSQLPMLPSHFVGRTSLVDSLYRKLSEKTPVFLWGSPGVGKTALVTVLVRRVISDVQDLDDVIWLDMANSSDVYALLFQHLGLSGTPQQMLSLCRAYLGEHCICLVLDNCPPDIDLASFIDDIAETGYLICIGDAAPQNLDGILVPPLSRDDTQHLLEGHDLAGEIDLCEQYAVGVASLILEYIYLRQFMSAEVVLQASRDIERWPSVWARLPEDSRLAWVFLSLLPSAAIADTLACLSAQTQRHLIESHVILSTTGGYYVYPSAAAFMREQPELSVDFSQFLLTYFKFLSAMRSFPRAWCEAVGHGILEMISLDDLAWFLPEIHGQFMAHRLWNPWQDSLSAWRPPNLYWRLWQRLAILQLMRRQGHFVDVERDAKQLIEDCGAEGEFGLYADTLLELAHSYAYQMRWREAQAATDDVLRAYDRFAISTDLLHKVQLLQADIQSYLDPQRTLEWMMTWDAVRSQEPEVRLVLGRCLIRIGQYDTARAILSAFSLQESPHAQLMLVQLAYLQSRYTQGATMLQKLISRLSELTEPVLLARAYNNLGVLYYAQDDGHSAQVCWRRGLDMASRLQDPVLSETIRQNMRFINPKLI